MKHKQRYPISNPSGWFSPMAASALELVTPRPRDRRIAPRAPIAFFPMRMGERVVRPGDASGIVSIGPSSEIVFRANVQRLAYHVLRPADAVTLLLRF